VDLWRKIKGQIVSLNAEVRNSGAVKQIRMVWRQVLRKDDEGWLRNAQLYGFKG